MARVNGVSFREDSSVESVCRRVVAAGFDSLEVSRPPFYEKLITPEVRRRFVEFTAELGLSLYGFDCWVDVDPYGDVEKTLVDFAAAIDWAAELDLGMVISHDPWAKDNGDRSPSTCLDASVELFQRVADLCAAQQLRLVFEPHPDTLSIENEWAIDFIDRLAAGATGSRGRSPLRLLSLRRGSTGTATWIPSPCWEAASSTFTSPMGTVRRTRSTCRWATASWSWRR